eukprot:TRINITY_DN53146_c0_g1_i1.p1 TRINITY_DN53146_c0_g1~~TRINITY_DN53146_c0_g1_i1.p1  ORF type:complete len:420 (+),score=8.97 TRINITY_DN53146_c0_g1_i1:138-1262(+)
MEELRSEGNNLFKLGRLDDAIEKYTASLMAPAATFVAQVLANLSAVALKQCRAQDAVAFASASLRLAGFAPDKAAWRLGQSLVLLRCFRTASTALKYSNLPQAESLLHQLPQLEKHARVGYQIPDSLTPRPFESVVEYMGPVRMTVIEGKGRGLVATRALEPSECVLVCRSLVHVGLEKGATTLVERTTNPVTRGLRTASSSKAVAWVSHKAFGRHTDPVFQRRLEVLTSGENCPDPVPLHRLLQCLDFACALPFLPARLPFASSRSTLDPLQAVRILDVNCHGDSREDADLTTPFDVLWTQDKIYESTSLFTSVSLLNHSRTSQNVFAIPLCSREGVGTAIAVYTMGHVAEGDELCASYRDDDEEVLRTWGVS